MSKQNLRNDAILAALRAIKDYPADSKRPSVNGTAKKFGLSESTLRRAIAGGAPPNRPGPPKVLIPPDTVLISREPIIKPSMRILSS